MSSGMFRGKESSNRILISSRLIQFWCFGLPVALGMGGGWGIPPHMCTCMHTHAHTRMHIYMLNMIIPFANGSPIGGIPGNSL